MTKKMILFLLVVLFVFLCGLATVCKAQNICTNERNICYMGITSGKSLPIVSYHKLQALMTDNIYDRDSGKIVHESFIVTVEYYTKGSSKSLLTAPNVTIVKGSIAGLTFDTNRMARRVIYDTLYITNDIGSGQSMNPQYLCYLNRNIVQDVRGVQYVGVNDIPQIFFDLRARGYLNSVPAKFLGIQY